MKKIFSLFLSLVMLMSCVPIQAMAEEEAGTSVNEVLVTQTQNDTGASGDTGISKETADAVVEQYFGSGTLYEEKDGGYVYAMSPEMVDSFVGTFSGMKQEAQQEETFYEDVNALPADYVDDSNEGVYEVLERIEETASLQGEVGTDIKVDLVFLIDSTGSMSGAISGVKSNVAEFAEYMASKGVTLRLGLIDFRDITCSEETIIHKAAYSPWMNVTSFLNELAGIRVSGGGDTPETPIDAMGFLTDGSTMMWSTDAYKFAILITDAPYKNNNTHGIANMEEMSALLNERDIYTSVITDRYCFDDYGELAAQNGGFVADIYGNFSELLANYANAILGMTLPEKEYTIQLIDSVTREPVVNASFTCDKGSFTTDASGIVKVRTTESYINTVVVTHEMYKTKSLASFALIGDVNNIIYLTANKISDKPIEDDDTPKFDYDSLPEIGSGSGDLSAPKLTIFGKTFGLINTKIQFKLPIFDECAITHNRAEKKFEVIIGKNMGEYEGKDDSYWKSDYKKFKALALAMEPGRSPKEIYNTFRSMRKDIKSLSDKKANMFFKFDCSIAGYAEYSYASDADEFIEGGVVVTASTPEFPIVKDFPIPAAPYVFINVSFKVDVGAKVGFIVVKKDPIKLDTPSVEFSLEPTLKASAALGAPKIASVGGGGTLTGAATLNIPFKNMRESASLNVKGSLFLEVKILGFGHTWTWPIPYYISLWPEVDFVASLNSEESVGYSDFKLLPRGSSADASLMSITSDDFILHQQDVYSYSSPDLIKLSDGRFLLVWIGDDVNREYSSDMAALMYSVYDDGEWSEIGIVDDDGTSDYNPTVCENPDGTVSIVWQDMSKAFETDEMTLEEALEFVDISYAVVDIDSGEVTENIVVSEVDSGIYKMLPMIAVNGDEVNVTWIENLSNSPLMFEGENQVYNVRKNAEGTFGEITLIAETEESITSIDTDYIDDVFTVVYGCSTYNDEINQLVCDNVINVVTYDDEIDESYIESTFFEDEEDEDNISTSSHIQIYDECIFWSDINGIYMVEGIDGDVERVTETVFDNFRLMSDEDGNAVIISTISEGLTNNIYSMYEEDGEWNLPVKVTDYDKNITNLSGFYNTDGKLYLAFNSLDVTGDESEVVLGGTDLIVAAVVPDEHMAVNPDAFVPLSDVAPGEEVEITCTVANLGAFAASGFKAVVYNGEEEVATVEDLYYYDFTTEEIEKFELSSIKGGETVEIVVPYTIPDELSEHTVTIEFVNADGEPVDDEYSKASVSIYGIPDVVVENVQYEAAVEGNKIMADVKNAGYAAATNVVVSFYDEAGKNTDTPIAKEEIEILEPGESIPVEFEVSPEYVTSESEFDYKRLIVCAQASEDDIDYVNNNGEILVEPVFVEGIEIIADSINVNLGSEKAIEFTILNENASNKKINWVSDNTRIVTVENGVITGVRSGSANVTALAADGSASDTVMVVVTSDTLSVDSIDFDQTEIKVSKGRKKTITANIYPENATNKTVVWSVDDESIAQIVSFEDNTCSIKGLVKGETTLYAVTEDGGYTSSVRIVVTNSSSAGGGSTAVTVSKNTAVEYTISFETNGGTSVVSQQVVSGNVAKKPADPSKNGYSFKGWYLDSEFTQLYSFSDAVNKNVTVYAKWELDEAKVIVLTINDKNASVFGKKVENDVAPLIVNERTMLPIRFIAEALNADVEWNDEKKEVTIRKDSTEIKIVINSDMAYINGEEHALDSEAFIKNSRTYLPIRFVSESLGATVEWDDASKTVVIIPDSTDTK